MMKQPSVVWFRNDLRLHDNETLSTALSDSTTVLPVYCFDPRQFGTTSFGFPKTGAFRAKFLIESVADLRSSLLSIGGHLVVRVGHPEEILPQLAAQVGATAIYFQKETTDEELRVERRLRQQLQPLGIVTKEFWGQTLYHLRDLPMSIQHLPDVFTDFRKQVEKRARVCDIFPTPKRLKLPENIDAGSLPTLDDFQLQPPPTDTRGVLNFIGGESAGLKRLHEYFWQKDKLKTYKETRNGLIGADYSSKFSAWLALGSLSPRKIYDEVKRYESERIANDSTYWLVFELIWRDYFRFLSLKFGNKIFQERGIKGEQKDWKIDWDAFERWKAGKTGKPLVDANMRELAATGFMSNRGRQNVASYLVRDLKVDWRLGAEYFESLLIDYDVCSNYGNWNYVAGIGNDPREDRYFNVQKQLQMYDPQAAYVKLWLPNLTRFPAHEILSKERVEYD